MNPIKLVIAFSILFVYTQGFAQKKNAKKSGKKSNITRVVDKDGNISLEFDVSETEGDNRTMALGNDGVLVYYTIKDKKVKNVVTYELVKFDKDLNEEYRTTYALPAKHGLIFHKENDSKVYFLIGETKASSVKIGFTGGPAFVKKYTIVRFDPLKNEFKKFDGNTTSTDKGAYIQDFNVSKDIAYMNINRGKSPATISSIVCLSYCACFIPLLFGAANPNLKPDLIVHDLEKKGKQRIINLGYDARKGNSGVLGSSLDDSTGTYHLFMTNGHKRLQTFWVKSVGTDGKMTKDVDVKLPPDKSISDPKMEVIDDKKYLFGIYNGKPKAVVVTAAAARNLTGIASQGVFFSVVSNNKLDKITFTPYSKLKFKLPLNRTEKKKLEKNNKKNKETSINLRVHYLKPLQYNDEIILVGEMYYATFRTEVYWDANGRMRTRQVFDGWAFTHILFTAYDLNGNLLWNQAIDYSRPKSYFIYDRVRTTLLDEGVIEVVYNDGASIKTAKVSKDGVEEGTQTYKLGGTKSGDKVTATGTSGSGADVVYWYDDFYLASGLQDIKNKQLKGKDKKREIYYIKKIEVE